MPAGRLALRGRRYPAGAQCVAVGAARRLRCGARSGVAPRNSLRSLRSLCSNSRGESVSRSAPRAPTPALRSSPPHNAPPPGTACRVDLLRIRGTNSPAPQQRGVRAGGEAHQGDACDARAHGPRAQRATTSDSRRLSEHSERSERSEFRRGAMSPGIAGESMRSIDRLRRAPPPARTPLCRSQAT